MQKTTQNTTQQQLNKQRSYNNQIAFSRVLSHERQRD